MATPALSSLFAQTFQTSASLDVKASDSFSSLRTISVAAAYYRLFLAGSAWTGTATQPKDLLRTFQAALNLGVGGTFWTVTLTAAGLVRITYAGGTGAASITWSSAALRNLLGFTGGTATFAAPGAFADGALQPLFCAFSHNARRGSTGRVHVPRKVALATTDDGRQYGRAARRAGMKVIVDLATHPTDTAAKTALNATATVTQATVVWPDDDARIQLPVNAPADTLAGPWSLVDFFNTVPGSASVGVALGTLPALVAGSSTAFWDMSIADSTLTAEDALEPSRPGFALLQNWKRVVLRLYAVRSRA